VLDPQTFPVWLNLLLFACAAAVIWMAGTRLARYADRISDRTGLGEALVGVVFLAIATSLPEIASVLTATSSGEAPLAVNNLLGSIGLQTAIVVIADRLSGGKALTHFIAQSVLLLEGLVVVILLGITLTGIGVGDLHGPLDIGVWPLLIFLTYLVGLYLVKIYQRSERWQPVDIEPDEMGSEETRHDESYSEWSNRQLYLGFAGGGAVILLAGTVVSRTGDALAGQSGLGGSFIGVTLLAVATSLPELSATVTAARIGAYSLGISNIFGSTMLMPALLFPADIFYRSGPVLAEVGRSAILAAGAGIVITAIYLVGLVEHRDRTVAGIGVDSALVAVVYLASLVGQYLLR
jgi:cation:H+ antiporter